MKRFSVLIFAVFFVFASCDDGNSSNNNSVSMCGDNFKDFNEECDGDDLGGRTCQDLGYYGGSLTCDNACLFDTSSCAAAGYCGDNMVNGEEECDGNELNGKDCSSFGFLGGGSLKCTDACHFDKSECLGEGLCGNGFADGTDEECDGSDFAGQTCITMGYYGGTLKCDSLCRIDDSECIATGKCGDGIVHVAYNEQCDADNMNGKTCESLGYNGGELRCDSSCHFDVGLCEGTGTCGDSIIQSDYEQCDGNTMGDDTCISFGYYGGFLYCTDSCVYDFTSCRGAGWCGDSFVQNEYEECDLNNLNFTTCEMLGYYGGTLACNSECEFDISGCVAAGICGDGTAQNPYESCDGTDLNGKTCEMLGYYGGTLACNSGCGFDISGCERCGDGIVQTPYEECDGSDFAVSECSELGFQPGDVTSSCLSDCKSDTSVCKTRWISMNLSSTHSCGIKSDGKLYCWGDNNYGQLGSGNTTNYYVPHQTGDATGWSIVTAGSSQHSCGVKEDGKLYCWGNNDYGQAGQNAQIFYETPMLLPSVDWSFVDTGFRFSCGVKTDGRLYCWGRNNYGQLGLGNDIEYHTPQQVGDATDWTTVATGGSHGCGLKTSGRLYCWGKNLSGQLGTGDTTNYNTPQQVGTDTDWTEISAGPYHSCGIKTDGRLYCWGNNYHGQLGTGDATDYNTPQQVGTDTDWIKVSAGAYHTCGLKTDGKLYCWGKNDDGQLGLGNDIEYYTPQQVGDATDWTIVKTGNSYSCGLKADGRLYCWGWNYYGQLGIGDKIDRHEPSHVNF